MQQLGRVLTAMVTPFKDNPALEVDYVLAKKLALALLASGSDGLVLCGTTGEAPTLSWKEELKLFEEVKSVVPASATIVAYTGSNSTSEAVEATRDAEKVGVDACLSVVPYYNKPSQEGIYRHFRTIAEATSLPVIMYNIPGRVVVNMTVDTIVRLSEITNIVGVKEASGNMEHVAQVLKRVTRPDFYIWSGNDGDTFPIMAMGGYGVIGVTNHVIGKQIKKMCDLIFANDVKAAATIHRDMVPLVNALMNTAANPAPVKYALEVLGIKVGPPRLPLVEPDEAAKKKIEAELKNYTIDIKL
jgi:4-hydroxy-tetrahydrodipicolinate synthase